MRNPLTEEQKHCFFGLLKQLLKTPHNLKDGVEVQGECQGETLTLAYWTDHCKITIRDSKGHSRLKELVPIRYVYLRWREGMTEEPLSPENLQRVQNELKLLGAQNEETEACFSLARIQLIKELQGLQSNTTMKIIYGDIILTFVSGEGENVATILYDNSRNKPMYSINVARWWVRTGRWIWIIFCGIGAVFGRVGDMISALESLMISLTSMVKSLSPLVKSLTTSTPEKGMTRTACFLFAGRTGGLPNVVLKYTHMNILNVVLKYTNMNTGQPVS